MEWVSHEKVKTVTAFFEKKEAKKLLLTGSRVVAPARPRCAVESQKSFLLAPTERLFFRNAALASYAT
jgi:hypothetical protein